MKIKTSPFWINRKVLIRENKNFTARKDGKKVYNKIDKDVAFFVQMLELLGAKTDSSCAGHPQGFYITFAAPYKLALKISSIGYFPVEILEKGAWRLSIPVHMTKSYSDRNRTLAWASEAWEEEFGKLKRGGISWAGNYKL